MGCDEVWEEDLAWIQAPEQQERLRLLAVQHFGWGPAHGEVRFEPRENGWLVGNGLVVTPWTPGSVPWDPRLALLEIEAAEGLHSEGLEAWMVGHEDHENWFHGVMVIAPSKAIALQIGRFYVEEPDTAIAQRTSSHLDLPPIRPCEIARVLSWVGDCEFYRAAGWAEDEGDSPCTCCSLYGYEELPGTEVCTECELCRECATSYDADEDPCPSCGLPEMTHA